MLSSCTNCVKQNTIIRDEPRVSNLHKLSISWKWSCVLSFLKVLSTRWRGKAQSCIAKSHEFRDFHEFDFAGGAKCLWWPVTSWFEFSLEACSSLNPLSYASYLGIANSNAKMFALRTFWVVFLPVDDRNFGNFMKRQFFSVDWCTHFAVLPVINIVNVFDDWLAKDFPVKGALH